MVELKKGEMMSNQKQECRCHCPHGGCEHNWTEETKDGVCRECGISWVEHRNEIYDMELFANLQRIM